MASGCGGRELRRVTPTKMAIRLDRLSSPLRSFAAKRVFRTRMRMVEIAHALSMARQVDARPAR